MKNMCSSGFTLIELLITVTILAILLALAVPSFNTLVRTNRVVTITNELVSAFGLARSEAIKRGALVTICKTANPNAANPTCSASASWQNGWIVFADGGVVGIETGDTLIRVGQPNAGNAVITPDSINFISFLSTGASAATASLVVCLEGVARTVSVNAIGRTSVAAGAC